MSKLPDSETDHGGRPGAPEPGISFPVRVAAIDTGSNGIRFEAAEFRDRTTCEVLEYERVPVRLGHDAFVSGKLSEAVMDAAAEAFIRFRARMEELDVGHSRAIATSAVRESRNGSEFVARVFEESGISVETITGTEEARLVWLAVSSRLRLADEKWILVDLGGGSVEVSLVDNSGTIWSQSHTMGSVRLLTELSGVADTPGSFRRLLAEYAGTLNIPAAAQHWKPAGLIATGGNIEALAALAGAEPDDLGVSRIAIEELRSVIDTLARLSYTQRVKDLGLREDRADVILPAAVVYERLGILAGVSTIIVPHVGIKNGILLDLVDGLASTDGHVDRQDQEVYLGAMALGRRYLFDERHAVRVTELARSLFDQLHDLHGLGDVDRRILTAAALVHEIGQFVSYRRHHRHSFYLVSYSDLPGLTAREILLTALVARYHRRAEPKKSHDGFRNLAAAERDRVRKLAALLRVADAFDREHLQRVEDLAVMVDGDQLIIMPDGAGDLLLEQWALGAKGRLFESVFGLKLAVARADRAAVSPSDGRPQPETTA
jgi:exopolyphosphatase/guanosine-5'-triphosphate,3'-diphosphate pyrophosphatase